MSQCAHCDNLCPYVKSFGGSCLCTEKNDYVFPNQRSCESFVQSSRYYFDDMDLAMSTEPKSIFTSLVELFAGEPAPKRKEENKYPRYYTPDNPIPVTNPKPVEKPKQPKKEHENLKILNTFKILLELNGKDTDISLYNRFKNATEQIYMYPLYIEVTDTLIKTELERVIKPPEYRGLEKRLFLKALDIINIPKELDSLGTYREWLHFLKYTYGQLNLRSYEDCQIELNKMFHNPPLKLQLKRIKPKQKDT